MADFGFHLTNFHGKVFNLSKRFFCACRRKADVLHGKFDGSVRLVKQLLQFGNGLFGKIALQFFFLFPKMEEKLALVPNAFHISCAAYVAVQADKFGVGNLMPHEGL